MLYSVLNSAWGMAVLAEPVGIDVLLIMTAMALFGFVRIL